MYFQINIFILLIVLICASSSCESKKRNQDSDQIDSIVIRDFNMWDKHPELNVARWIPKSETQSIAQSDFDSLLNYSLLKGKLHGQYFSYFENGQTRISGEFAYGKPVGTFRRFWNNGNIRDYVQFENGLINEIHYVKYIDQELNAYCHYNEGVPDYIKIFDKNGKLIDSMIAIFLTGEVMRKDTFYKDEKITFVAGFNHSGVSNPIFRYSVILNRSDTILSHDSESIKKDLSININSVGRKSVRVLIEEYESKSMTLQGEASIDFDIYIIAPSGS